MCRRWLYTFFGYNIQIRRKYKRGRLYKILVFSMLIAVLQFISEI